MFCDVFISDFSEASHISISKEELGNGLGNLLNRCTSQKLNPDQIYPCINRDVYEAQIMKGNVDPLEKLKTLVGKLTTKVCFYMIKNRTEQKFYVQRLVHIYIIIQNI